MSHADRLLIETVMLMTILRLITEDLVQQLDEVTATHDALADQADRLFMQRITSCA